MDRPTTGDLENYINKVGQPRANKLFSILGKNREFVNALSTTIGTELMKEVVNQMEVLLEKIIEVKATPEELAEYRVLQKISLNWIKRINTYLRGLKDIKAA